MKMSSQRESSMNLFIQILTSWKKAAKTEICYETSLNHANDRIDWVKYTYAY